MKTIIFKQNKEVQIGDTIELNGLKVEVTQKLIDENPEHFDIKGESFVDKTIRTFKSAVDKEGQMLIDIYYNINTEAPEYVRCIQHPFSTQFMLEKGKIYPVKNNRVLTENGTSYPLILNCFIRATKKEYLIQETHKKYPRGTRFLSGSGNGTYTSKGIISTCEDDLIGIDTVESHDICVYSAGWWADVTKPLFSTQDGKVIYAGESFFQINRGDIVECATYTPKENGKGRFSTRKAAEEYQEKKKEEENRNNIIDLHNTISPLEPIDLWSRRISKKYKVTKR